MRYTSIVPMLQRQASQDAVIPLSAPVKTKTGEIITSVPVSKGQRVFLSITGYNRPVWSGPTLLHFTYLRNHRLKSVWGEDADKWRPERFLDTDENSVKPKTGLGVVGNIATFGSGLRSCIG